MENIKNLLGVAYLRRFKVFHPDTLFPPQWENLKQYRCPLCSNKLKQPLKKNIYFCDGKKHGRRFVVRADVLCQITGYAPKP